MLIFVYILYIGNKTISLYVCMFMCVCIFMYSIVFFFLCILNADLCIYFVYRLFLFVFI